jgi:tetratricopeptide (TPR) repeat protein
VAIDRSESLRSAEKLLRQGKLDLAIAEYLRIVEDQPRDWNTGNLLGDLYMRAGRTDKAVEQFVRIADSLKHEGFLPKAGALYKKVLKIKPDDEHVLLQWAEVAASQGLLADARNALNSVAERRRKRGDERGVAQIRIRLGTLDPADFKARANAARARAEIGDNAGALSDLTALAADLRGKGREADAIEVLEHAAALNPDNNEIRERLIAACLAAGDLERARRVAATADQLKSLAAALDAAGTPDQALEARREAARLDPADSRLREDLARAFVARGDLAAAGEYLTAEIAGDDVQLLLIVAEIRLRSLDAEEGLVLIARALEKDPTTREAVALLGWNIAERAPEAAFRVVEKAADAAVAQSDWPGAAAALQEFVTRVPNHVPALMRLVEICVDGGLEATMQSAQAELADAYLAAGAGAEARFIAEDLVAREPWDRANVERFRRALVLLGEPDPDALIAQRLSGQTPFTTTDLSVLDFPPFEGEPETEAAGPTQVASAPDGEVLQPEAAARIEHPESVSATTPRTAAGARRDGASAETDTGHFELIANGADLESILVELESAAGGDHAIEGTEVDLSVVLEDFKTGKPGPAAQGSRGWRPSAGTRDAGAVALDERQAGAKYAEAVELHKSGRIDEAIRALHDASRVPLLRFQTASLLGRIYRERQTLPQAIEWFERAAEAPAPSPDEGHLLLYELAELLEFVGETARALAICLELQAEAGDYRDLSARIERLARIQTRG